MNYVYPIQPTCCSCGDTIYDDGADQTDAWLASMCPGCHEACQADCELVSDAEDSEYYGGDSPGSYGPSDARFGRVA